MSVWSEQSVPERIATTLTHSLYLYKPFTIRRMRNVTDKYRTKGYISDKKNGLMIGTVTNSALFS